MVALSPAHVPKLPRWSPHHQGYGNVTASSSSAGKYQHVL